MNFNRIAMTIVIAMATVLMASCGNAPEEGGTPAVENEVPAVTEEIALPEADGEESETETVPEIETTEAETTTETEPEAPTEARPAPVQDGSWASGVWKPDDDDEMYVFTPQGQATMLREMDTAWYDEYMRFENGEIILTEETSSAYGELVEITRAEDADNFRIYRYPAILEDGLEGMSVHYILDKDERLYVLYSDILKFSYEASADSLTFIMGYDEEEIETISVEAVDSGHVNLTGESYGELYTVTLVRIPHLDAVVDYLD